MSDAQVAANNTPARKQRGAEAEQLNPASASLPFSSEAEQALIGALILDNTAWDRIGDQVNVDHFYHDQHKDIFSAIAGIIKEGQPCDVLTLSQKLSDCKKLDKVGGEAYLFELTSSTPSAANIGAYADIVKQKAVMRGILKALYSMSESVHNPEGRSPTELLDEIEQKIFALSNNATESGGPQELADILAVTTDKIDKLYNSTGAMTGLATGFYDLDKMTSGLQPSDLIIVAGRPSMGKTIFGVNCAENAALNSPYPALMFSLEMPSDAIAMRMLASLGRVHLQNIRTGSLTDDDWPRLTSAISMLSESKFLIDDTPALTPTELRARARRVFRKYGGISLIVIDYLQLMRVPSMKDNRVGEISEISRSLKVIAKELNVPVIALSQLNRSLEQRTDRRPVMSDLRESGAIEQDADLIMFVYRDEVYNEDSPDKGTAELIVGKHRNGPIGKVRLTFHGHFVRFDNFASDEQVISFD